MIGIQSKDHSADLRAKLHEAQRNSVGSADNVKRLLPPLIIDDGHIDEAIQILSNACAQIEEAS
jgi:acetylornithine/N-succinyldiaminopimelate aminotransferase